MAEKEKDKKRAAPKNLADLLKGITKEYGDGAIMQGRNCIVRVDSFPTGVATIDMALGCGGLPQGRVIELFGHESSGKTTTCLHIIGACQRHYFEKKERHGVAAFVDAEHAFDPTWAEKCGVNIETLLFSQPNSGEEAMDIVERLVESGLVDVVIVDSVANIVPLKELEGEMGASNIGGQARLMSQGLRKISAKMAKSQTTVVFTNQVRQKIGVMFGSPDTTPGGLALKFYASVRGDIRKGAAIKDGDTVLGFRPTIKFIKNKVAPPFTSAEFNINTGNPVCGIDEIPSLIEVGSGMGLITQKGSFYSFNGQRLGNGLAAATEMVRDATELQKELREKIYSNLLQRVQPAPSVDGEEELADDLLDGDDDGDS